MRSVPFHSFLVAVLLLADRLACSTVRSQQYNDQDGYEQEYGGQDSSYNQDNLYHDYAIRQQQKEEKAGGQGFAWGSIAVGGAVGWLAGGRFHSSRLQKKLNAKHKEDQKALYKQYYNDVYSLQAQNQELINALEQYGVKVK